MKICLTYPGGDGELHFNCEAASAVPFSGPEIRTMKVSFEIAMKDGETELDALKRAATDILSRPAYQA